MDFKHKLLMLKCIRPFVDEFTALTITKTMLLPYLDMGNMFFTALPAKDMDQLKFRVFNTLLNTALRIVYRIKYPSDIHRLKLYTKADLLPLEYRRKYFLLNLTHRMICTQEIMVHEPIQITRATQAHLVVEHYTPYEKIKKSTVF